MLKSVAAVLLLAAAASCFPFTSFEFKGKPYAIVNNEKLSWFDADAMCNMRKFVLASIDDQAEFDYIRGQLVARGLQNTQVWIGGTEIGIEDNYYWANTGHIVDLDQWDDTEVLDPNARCMVFYKGKWRHFPCQTPAYFICEARNPVTTVAPTTTTTLPSGR